jgi:hypothetical protein
MRIGLIDVDGKNFPNLALMKISAWHKQNGDHVEWYEPMFSGHMDKVYLSKVFTFTPDYEYCIDADEIIKGGTGYKLYNVNLPEEMEHIFPDYSIYPQYDYAIGFLTRGCIRSCPWCVVPKKEGKLCAYDTWQHIKRPDSKKIVFMDNNVLASDHGVAQIEEMTHEDIRIDFNQGLDARLIDKEKAKILSQIKWLKYLRVACDTSAMLPIIRQALDNLNEYGFKSTKVWSYVLIEDVEDAYKRITQLAEWGVEPFAQPYIDFEGGQCKDKEAKRLARWCNMKAIFKTVKWQDYK